ncbi:MAG: RNA polymerase factor sigma-54 [Prolixibacteraceae bacterium]|jgi:RNA polymerase sigma-54 factor
MQHLSLQQRLLQKLSPQQIQVIKLLELPMLQLEARIKKELEENPVLELEDNEFGKSEEELPDDLKTKEDNDHEEFSVDDYLNEEDYPTYRYEANNFSKDEKTVDMPYSEASSFHEYLQEQIAMVMLNEKDAILAEQIIGNIDEDGYLRRELDSIVDDVAFARNIHTDMKSLNRVLKLIQELDPPGVGARDLRECLLIQLTRKDGGREEIRWAYKILDEMFEEFTKKHYDKIQRKLNLEEENIREALDEILKLNPKPGSSYSNSLSRGTQTIIPDFILDIVNDDLILSLNQRNVPELNISNYYTNMLKGFRDSGKEMSTDQKEALYFVKQKIDSAKWFIDAIKQRQETLMLVMKAMLRFQKAFFLEGDETKLRPMILKDIADMTGLDISTISRVSNSKYIQTHFGIYSLKYFFSESMQKEDGEEVSTREIKSILKECIANENKLKPVTDDELASILKDKGYNIARRTVAKYREQLDIPVARMRKEL